MKLIHPLAWLLLGLSVISMLLGAFDLSLGELMSTLQSGFTAAWDFLRSLLPSGSWTLGLLAGLCIAAIPFLLGLAIDGKGQSASGFVLMITIGVSILLGGGFLLVYFGLSAVYLVWDFFFGG